MTPFEQGRSDRALGADIIIANAPDPVFVSDLEGKILQANEAVSQLLGLRPEEPPRSARSLRRG
jgi:PAS domain-containing protein